MHKDRIYFPLNQYMNITAKGNHSGEFMIKVGNTKNENCYELTLYTKIDLECMISRLNRALEEDSTWKRNM